LPVWPARVRQTLQTASRFSRPQLEQAVELMFKTDLDLRQDRPEDRVVMEKLVWTLTN
ncbi:MAG: hypothetical protein HY236_14330, partial [Acidobacteria bacterium]|nr:hypothetical protein [Acidobacteriota bacterium]